MRTLTSFYDNLNQERKEALINRAAQVLANKEIGFSNEQLKKLKNSYEDLRGKTISFEKANALSKLLDKQDLKQNTIKAISRCKNSFCIWSCIK
jgi:cell shape-determining protein MreC